MKYTIPTLVALMALSMPACAQGKQQAAKAIEAKADTLPYTYKSFMAQKDVRVTKGLNNADGLALNIYQIGDKYYLEIPRPRHEPQGQQLPVAGIGNVQAKGRRQQALTVLDLQPQP